MNLFPVPQTIIRKGSGRLERPLHSWEAIDFVPSPRLQNALDRLAFFEADPSSSPTGKLRLRLSSENPSNESYQITIDDSKVEIAASTEPGFYRGFTTLSQLFALNPENPPCLRIEDQPDISVRGYMLDISRCKVPKLESLFLLVDQLASLKFNQLQLYTEHTFAYRDHQKVWEKASPLSPEEVRSLDSYCYDRYIELVPNQNSFGHMDRWLRHEAYQHLAECPNGYEHPISGPLPWGGTLKPNQASIDFVEKLYDELLPHFRSDKLNIGGDEPWELGQGWSSTLVQQKGKHRVYLDHLIALHKVVERKGKKMQFWGDIILESPELAKELPKDVVGVIWGYEADHPFEEQCSAFQDSGIPFYVAPGTSAWNTIGGRQNNSVANIKEATKQAIRHGAHGMLLTDWGDFGHHHFPPISYPAIALAGALSWNRNSSDALDIIQGINCVFFDNESVELAQLIFLISDATNSFEYKPINRTLLNDLLFADQSELPTQLNHTNPIELNQCLSRLSELKASANRISVSTNNASLSNKELQLTLDHLIFACEKGLSPNNHPTVQANVERQKQLWLARNREGGLDESLSYFAHK